MRVYGRPQSDGLDCELPYSIPRGILQLITPRRYNTLNVKVGTVKKSIAAMVSRWLRRRRGNAFLTQDPSALRLIHREMVGVARSKPSRSGSTWMRSAPQVAFCATMRKINSRTCFGVPLLPTGFLTFEISFQYIRKPARRTTVSGSTTVSACFQVGQSRRTSTQKSFSGTRSVGRGCRRFRTAGCCRSSKFSRRGFLQPRQRRTNAPK
jgi:hypothetical protein